MIEIKECPVCGAKETKTVRKAPFFRGEREWFTIAGCQSCGFWFTSPRPELEKLGDYYEADNYVSHTDGGKSLFDHAYKMVRSYALKKKLHLGGKTRAEVLLAGCGRLGQSAVRTRVGGTWHIRISTRRN